MFSRKAFMELRAKERRLLKKRIAQLETDTQAHERDERQRVLVQLYGEPVFCGYCEEEIRPDDLADAARVQVKVQHKGGSPMPDWEWRCKDCK